MVNHTDNSNFSYRNVQGRNLWYERMMAAIAVANLTFVMFDLTYVNWRDFWLRGTLSLGPVSVTIPLPPVTQAYDWVKNIKPHRETQKYLNTVSALETELQQNGIQSPNVGLRLQELREQSEDMIRDNPFQGANKSGTLEKIKNRMRDRIFPNSKDASSRKAFATFWSPDYLQQKGVSEEMKFFNQQIRPLVASNYYRTIEESGEFTDYFGVLDLPFIALFGFEFLTRTLYISRRHRLKWIDAMLWRWYDVLFLIPFWRWMRIIPVLIRLDQAKLISLARIRDQATQGVVSNVAEELTEAVVTQVIDRLQGGLQNGALGNWLIQRVNRPYQDLNQRDEVQELTSHVLKLTVYQVMPKIKPELEALVRHIVEAVLEQAPGYKNLKAIPLVGDLPGQVNRQLVSTVTAGAYDAIAAALEDQIAAQLLSELVKNFGQTIVTELQQGNTLEELQTLLSELMEEIKVNYVSQIALDDVVVIENKNRLQTGNSQTVTKSFATKFEE
ncbi:MAG: hypothetical protein VKJ24_08500 [Synechococcales bacterium]|nr:hypothetical protein [Synechococcales bacterium]